MDEQIVFGDRMIPVKLPDRTKFLPQGLSTSLPPVADLKTAIQEALRRPLDLPPLRDLAKPGWKVTVAFDDPTVPCYGPVWEPAIRSVLEDLEHAGVKQREVYLLCANALHRKFTRRELAKVIGKGLVEEFGYRLLCHDAEDRENLVYLGTTPNGYDVEVNRLVTDCDLTIYINTVVWRGFNGGWKSICVGLSTYRSIRWHHSPEGMSMSVERNPMHEMLDEMGALLEEKIGKGRIFKMETVLANPLQVARLWTGTVGETRRAALEVLKKQYPPRREMAEEKADILIYGVPDWSPYASFSVMNPLLTLVSTGLGYLGGVIEALGKPGCSVILATPCPDQWDDIHHPPYREVWHEVLGRSRDPYEIRDLFEEDFAHRPEYLYKYQFCYGFHPIHGILATYPLKRLKHAARVLVAGAQNPSLVTHLGFEPTDTVEAAIARAEQIHGKDSTIIFIRNPLVRSRQ
jgi:Lactate racemase N-terminal domain